ncbi:MAG: TIGR03013 family XrtA/PEP-CTERM system glycosyltransferase [Steroidobacteraceae bacterium]
MRIRVFGQYVYLSIAILTVIEAVLFYGSVYGAVFARFHGDYGSIESLRDLRGALWPRALLFALIMVMCLLAFGLYSARQRARLAGIVLRLAVALATGLAATAALFYLIPDLWIGRGVVGLSALGALCGTIASRVIFTRVVDEQVFKRRVLIYGAGESAAAIAELRRRADRRGFILVGFVPVPGEPRAVESARILDPAEGLVQLCDRLDVVEVVVAMDDRRRGFPISELLQCRLAGIDVTELLTFLERETGRVRLDILNPAWMIFGEGFRRDPLRLLTARALDLLASVIVLTISLPVMLVTAIAIKLEGGGKAPVFYRQRRVGLLGRPFELLKFRSMRPDAEQDGQARWASKGDPRVTRVGAFIRKTRIDELPQILNVLRGQMSFVGPRPERPEFVRELAERIPYYVERHCVKPGLTGWAQLCYAYGSSDRDALEKLQYDLYYIKNNTLLFDLAIVLQTVEVVCLGMGAR